MSSQYPVLNNKPIDQWKVTELKDELRRRKITVRGLKEELVRRLFDAIRNEEMDKDEEVVDEDQPDHPASHPQPDGDQVPTESSAGDHNNVVADPIGQTDTDTTMSHIDANHTDVITDPVGKTEKTDCDAITTEIDINQEIKVQDATTITSGMDIEVSGTKTNMLSLEDTAIGSHTITTECESNVLITRSEEKGEEAVHEEKGEEAVHEEKGEEAVHEGKGEEAMHEDSDVPREDIKLSLPESDNQVSVDSPDLGSQVKCESIPIDSVSIIEKNKLKDNLNADDFHLEQEVVKQEMVQPSSSTVPSIGGDLQTLDDAKEQVKHLVSLEDNDALKSTNFDLSKKEDNLDEGSPEKLNLDRTSSDELMEEDVLESKHIESNIKSEEVARNTEVKQEPAIEEKTNIDGVLSGSISDKKDTVDEGHGKPILTIEKRKLEDQEAVISNEAPKRQRRWNSETVKVPERQPSNLSTATTPKNAHLPTPRRVFAKSESKSSGDSPKERIVPPSQKPVTTSLRIDRFLRPFTLKAVQELLGKTGTVCSFWMDHIKTHCYVTYSSADEANATRNAVYNLQWPPNGGNLLVAEFVDPQEVKARVEAPPQSPAPITSNANTPKAPNFQQPQAGQPPSRQHPLRQQLPLHALPPTLSDPPAVRERLPPPPPPPREPEPPALTLDDLFKKTKATPRIYYLPVSEEEVASKLAAQGKKH